MDNWNIGNELTEVDDAANYDAHHVEWKLERERDEALARATAAEAEVERLRAELADVLEVALVRGNWFGYSDDAYLDRWEEVTGREWDDDE